MRSTTIAAFLSLLTVGATFAASKIGATETAYNWQNVAIVGGGFVTGIIFHPREKGVIYARTDIGGAYRWDTKSRRWISLSDWVSAADWNFTGIESIGVDPSDPNRLYMAIGTYTNSWAGNGAIVRSNDQGTHWQRVNVPFKMGGNEDGRFAGERLVVDPNKNDTLFFGSRRNGLWKSKDFGATWNLITAFPQSNTKSGVGIPFVVFDGSSGTRGSASKTIYAGLSSPDTGLYRSRDGGDTWEVVPGQPTGLLSNHGVLTSEGALYLSYGDAAGPNGMSNGAIWKLDTKTDIWTDVTPLKPGNDDHFGYGGLTVDVQHPQTLMVSTMDRWAKHDDIFRSTDGGKSWKSVGQKSERDPSISPFLTWGRGKADLGHWLGDIEIDPFDSGHVLYVTGATIWASDDANALDTDSMTHWYVGANGLEECVVSTVVSPSDGASLLSAVGDIDGFRHEDLSVSPRSGFYQPAHGSNSDVDIAEVNPNIAARLFGGNNTHGSYSLDNGKTWTEFATRPSEQGSGTVAVNADGSSFIVVPDRTMPLVTHNKGMSWAFSKGLSKRLRVVSDRAESHYFYTFDNESGTIYVSKDDGNTFAPAAADLPKTEGFLRAVPGKPGHLYLTMDKGLFQSTDSGATFHNTGTVEKCFRIGFGKAAPGSDYPAIYMTGTVNGVYGIYRSDDKAAHWTRINDDQHQYAWISTITGDPRVYGRVYIGSGSRGILYGDPKK